MSDPAQNAALNRGPRCPPWSERAGRSSATLFWGKTAGEEDWIAEGAGELLRVVYLSVEPAKTIDALPQDAVDPAPSMM